MHEFSSAVAVQQPRVTVVALAGLAALAVAMGIGRFAFTPILPVMEVDTGLTLKAAGWLAAANYLGYFLGALIAARLSLAWAVRGGLVWIAGVTFAMGVTDVFWLQLVLRLAAGVASALVLIHVSAWGLGQLAAAGRRGASGVLFAGVGVGIGAAGLVSLATMQVSLDSAHTWQVFGVLALVVTAVLWRGFGGEPARVQTTDPAARRICWDVDKWRLMACYFALGIGYIIPATYLPAMAHRYISNPNVFGLAWPVFGAAAALSTWAASRWLEHVNDRKLWAAAYVAMLIGVALPAVWPGLSAILVAALLVGGTFMVVTMLGLREARRVAGSAGKAFIAVMTAAFAVGQIAGPLLVSAVVRQPHGFQLALLGAALVLLVAAVALWRSATPAAS